MTELTSVTESIWIRDVTCVDTNRASCVTRKESKTMGLDVYVYRSEDRAAEKFKEETYEKIVEQRWKGVDGYDNASKEDRDRIEKENEKWRFRLD